MLYSVFFLLVPVANAAFSVHFAGNHDVQVADNHFRNTLKAEHVADLYARVSGKAPLLHEGNCLSDDSDDSDGCDGRDGDVMFAAFFYFLLFFCDMLHEFLFIFVVMWFHVQTKWICPQRICLLPSTATRPF